MRLLALLFLLTSCAAFRSENPDALGNVERETAAHHLQLAAADLESGRLEASIDRLERLHRIRGLSPEERNLTDRLLESALGRLFEERAGENFDSDDFLEIYELELPTRLKARAGLLAARKMFEEGNRVRAFRQVQKVETQLPNHPERNLAGEVLAEAGLSLAADDRRYNLIFNYRSRGVQALEYLVITYPFNRRCDLAYHTLATIYEERKQVRDAIARYEDLIIYHPDSPYAVAAEARLPALRMAEFDRDDYDRGELLLAQQELEAWRDKHRGHELEPEVLATLEDCQARLTRSDLGLARYYRRIGNPFGARLHAERALAEAELTSLEELRNEAIGLLEDLPTESTREKGERADPEPLPGVEDE